MLLTKYSEDISPNNNITKRQINKHQEKNSNEKQQKHYFF